VSSPVEITRDSVDGALRGAGGERLERWNARSDEAKDDYVERLRQGAREPGELAALLADPEAAEGWAEVHWLLKAEFCAWINEGRIGFTRRRRAAFALRRASGARLTAHV
jgi:hypothetical protein